MSLRDWFPTKCPKVNPSAPVWTDGVCTLQVEILSAHSIEELRQKANAFAANHMVAGIDIRKDKESGAYASVDAYEKAAGVKKEVWYAQINYWVKM